MSDISVNKLAFIRNLHVYELLQYCSAGHEETLDLQVLGGKKYTNIANVTEKYLREFVCFHDVSNSKVNDFGV